MWYDHRNNEEQDFLVPSRSNVFSHANTVGPVPFLTPGTWLHQEHGRPTTRGFLLTLFMAFGIFSVSTGAARYFFPRGTGGRQPDLLEGGSFAERGGDGYTTDACTGDLTKPAMKGADVVSYHTLEPGNAAMYGSAEYQSIYHDYTFMFVSAENKALFDEDPDRYVPAWGGFCSWGISRETWFTKETLGPDADPNSWLISEDGTLYFFRSEVPKSKFVGDIAGNIVAGNELWDSWWSGTTSPFDTSCFCSVDTCLDQ